MKANETARIQQMSAVSDGQPEKTAAADRQEPDPADSGLDTGLDTERISVRALVEFILRSGDIDDRIGRGFADLQAMHLGSRLHRKIQKSMGSNYQAEVPLAGFFGYGDFQICVEGRADGILTDEKGVMVDEIKGIRRSLEHLEEPAPVHLAQAKCYAYLYGREQGYGLPSSESGSPSSEAGQPSGPASIRVRLSYANLETEEMKYFTFSYSFCELEQWFTGVLDEYRKWAAFSREWRMQRNASIRRTVFPFPYREGQRDLAAAVYRTIVHEKLLFIQAPTGTGKTLSTVFPAVKAMGEEKGERIFYLTARTIARTVASEAFAQLRGTGLRIKTVILTAKEKICPLETTRCNPDDCPYAKGHYDRINSALFELITQEDGFDRERILEAAGKYMVCPFELSLDLSSWMDAIICDYNYVFDPQAKLKRFFGEGVRGDYLFLIDEAHNLVERGREMYSASLTKESFLNLRKKVKGYSPELGRVLGQCNRKMLEQKKALLEDSEKAPGENGDGTVRIRPQREETWKVITDLGTLPLTLLNLTGVMESFLEEGQKHSVPEEIRQEILDLYFEVLTFLDVLDSAGEGYLFYEELLPGGDFYLKLYCVDPSERLQQCMNKARGSILFSATLLPVDYYKSLLCREEEPYAVYAKTCFPTEHLKVLVGRDTSSRYTRRTKEEYQRIASYIVHVASGKKGNYMVFFSSYKMMEETREILQWELPAGYELLCQSSGMDEKSREDFLHAFSENKENGLIGMCVMGSYFGEGIDLKHDRLIGVIVVGTALPMVCTQREILRQYYESRGEDGFRFAYLAPGMNKVMQAVGRVIRTEEDKGIAVLLDERFAQSGYRSMFPREWEGYQYCTLADVDRKLESFWNQ